MSKKSELLAAHQKLDFDCRNRKGRPFISDWYCDNPCLHDILRGTDFGELGPVSDYYFPNDHSEVCDRVYAIHQISNRPIRPGQDIFLSGGASPLISAQMNAFRSAGIERVHYVKPIYYTYYYLADLLGIELVALNPEPFEPIHGEELSEVEVVLMANPVWFAGQYQTEEIISGLQAIQMKTDCLIVVDSAFEFQRWGDTGRLAMDKFDDELTFRNFSPTKTVCVHGVRLAYSIFPNSFAERLRYAYSNLVGSASYLDSVVSCRILDFLKDNLQENPIATEASRRFSILLDAGILSTSVVPESAYFCFGRVSESASEHIAMSGLFFDWPERPDDVRINLLMPRADMELFLRPFEGLSESILVT